MVTVAVTGAAGTVGRALTPRLRRDHTVVAIDRPDADIRTDPGRIRSLLRGCDVVVHLAFDPGGGGTPGEHWRLPTRNPVNTALFETVLDAALDARVGLFLHASSVHVEDTMSWARRTGASLLTARPGVFATETPSGYGRSKRDQEARLQAVADRFARGAVSLRLGGVTPDGAPLAEAEDPDVLEHERRVWLAHDDLAELVSTIIGVRATPGFDVVYAVSDNPRRFHDVSNRYGWTPRRR
ncbi:NAD-dependent epimerase/dehydratase family protein [Mycolicibacterium litorale]|uniref:NAD-dependent epimerase/dehydratase family protein n=1 Tax=Mycolicibacterium litorale TaxID=758802 RepID=UPI0039A10986